VIWTTTEAAAELSIARRTVQKYCGDLGIRKAGRDYLIDKPSMARLREAVAAATPGRPRTREQA
jgi:hypothetical protein